MHSLKLFLLVACCSVAHFTYAQPLNLDRSTQTRSFEDFFLPKRALDKTKLGINAFVNDLRFGTIRSQFREVRSTLGLRHTRILFAWNDQIQPTPQSKPFWGFYDEIARSFAPGQDAIVVITGLPSWMKDSKNWINGDPRLTFVEKWVKPVVSRYRRNAQITGWQLWNEPNDENNDENVTLDFVGEPRNYLEFFARASSAAKDSAPRKLVINAATTAIAQNFDETLQYNKDLVSGGILTMTDIFATHFYGKSIEVLLVPGGVGDFFKSVSKPIWITESGTQGVLNQRDYAQRVFPYLLRNYPQIKRIYIYQFTESTPAETSYGLRTLVKTNAISDLYIYLRDKK